MVLAIKYFSWWPYLYYIRGGFSKEDFYPIKGLDTLYSEKLLENIDKVFMSIALIPDWSN